MLSLVPSNYGPARRQTALISRVAAPAEDRGDHRSNHGDTHSDQDPLHDPVAGRIIQSREVG